MASDDVRSILDPLAVAIRGRVRFRRIPEQTYTPPASTADPDPEPVTVPARTEVYVDPADMPDELKSPDGRLDLGSQLAAVQAAVARWMDLEIHTITGSVTYAPLVGLNWAGNSERVVDVAWRSTPSVVPKGAVARVDASVVAAGRVSADVVEGSITVAGCKVRVAVLGTVPVVLSSVLPLTVTVTGLYLAWPEFEG